MSQKINNTEEAFKLLDEHIEWLDKTWSTSPEGLDYKNRFTQSVLILKNCIQNSVSIKSYELVAKDSDKINRVNAEIKKIEAEAPGVKLIDRDLKTKQTVFALFDILRYER